jgi:hypothetical protein
MFYDIKFCAQQINIILILCVRIENNFRQYQNKFSLEPSLGIKDFSYKHFILISQRAIQLHARYI